MDSIKSAHKCFGVNCLNERFSSRISAGYKLTNKRMERFMSNTVGKSYKPQVTLHGLLGKLQHCEN